MGKIIYVSTAQLALICRDLLVQGVVFEVEPRDAGFWTIKLKGF